MADDIDTLGSADGGLGRTLDQLAVSTRNLETGANSFARAMAGAFTQSVSGGKQLDDVLKGLALRLSNIALTQALKPVAGGLVGGLNQVFTGLFGGGAGSNVTAQPGAMPFASGGVIGAPTYFPLATGGLGLAGEAGPEAILPLARGNDGRLGVAAGGAAAPNVTVHIATPDLDNFRRSEGYVTGQIARAVARGQRRL
jgi:phage-related minor tail protein